MGAGMGGAAAGGLLGMAGESLLETSVTCSLP